MLRNSYESWSDRWCEPCNSIFMSTLFLLLGIIFYVSEFNFVIPFVISIIFARNLVFLSSIIDLSCFIFYCSRTLQSICFMTFYFYNKKFSNLLLKCLYIYYDISTVGSSLILVSNLSKIISKDTIVLLFIIDTISALYFMILSYKNNYFSETIVSVLSLNSENLPYSEVIHIHEDHEVHEDQKSNDTIYCYIQERVDEHSHSSCSICLEPFTFHSSELNFIPEINAIIQLISCKHYFHEGCILRWFKEKKHVHYVG